MPMATRIPLNIQSLAVMVAVMALAMMACQHHKTTAREVVATLEAIREHRPEARPVLEQMPLQLVHPLQTFSTRLMLL